MADVAARQVRVFMMSSTGSFQELSWVGVPFKRAASETLGYMR